MTSVYTFFKHLKEQVQAKKGDWVGSVEMLNHISELVINIQYKNIDKIKFKNVEYTLLENNDIKYNYILGNYENIEVDTKQGIVSKKVFQPVFAITFQHFKTSKIYGKLYNVSGVGVLYKGSGLSTFMYKYFIKKMKYTILGDSEQYFGARKLWSVLSKEVDVQVDLYNIQTDNIIEENVTLYHGDYNNEFDKRLWSYSKEKHYIRSILKDIK